MRTPSIRLAFLVAASLIAVGCQRDEEQAAATCQDVESAPATYEAKGRGLVGDVDADGKPDHVTLRFDETRPARCRRILVVEIAGGSTSAAVVPPLPWPGTDPKLLLLAQIDGRPGLEPVVAMSPAAVYRPGRVFTLVRGELVRMRLERASVPDLFPFYDEFPAGVDCAGTRGTIVVTQGQINEENDGFWDLTRTVYRAAEGRFQVLREERFKVEVGPEAGRRWPEVRGDPFLTCRNRVR